MHGKFLKAAYFFCHDLYIKEYLILIAGLFRNEPPKGVHFGFIDKGIVQG